MYPAASWHLGAWGTGVGVGDGAIDRSAFRRIATPQHRRQNQTRNTTFPHQFFLKTDGVTQEPSVTAQTPNP